MSTTPPGAAVLLALGFVLIAASLAEAYRAIRPDRSISTRRLDAAFLLLVAGLIVLLVGAGLA